MRFYCTSKFQGVFFFCCLMGPSCVYYSFFFLFAFIQSHPFIENAFSNCHIFSIFGCNCFFHCVVSTNSYSQAIQRMTEENFTSSVWDWPCSHLGDDWINLIPHLQSRLTLKSSSRCLKSQFHIFGPKLTMRSHHYWSDQSYPHRIFSVEVYFCLN